MLLAFRQASEQQSKYSSRACCLQGWLDITYLDPKGEFRLSRGNKGTLFVLTRDEPAKAQLLAALTSKSSNAEVIYSFGRPGFEQDFPKVAQLVRNMAFDDNKLSDLEDTMFSADKYGGKNQEKAVEEWISRNNDWVDKLKTGQLAEK